MDGQQDRLTNSEAARMTDWKHLKRDSAPIKPNFPESIQFVCCLNAQKHEKDITLLTPFLPLFFINLIGRPDRADGSEGL